MSKARAISVLRHEAPDLTHIDDDGTVFSLVTVICGTVTGEVDVYIHREPGGKFVQSFSTRIDGVTQGRAGVAGLEADRVGALADLAAVADILSDELAKLKNPSHVRTTTATGQELFDVRDGASRMTVTREGDEVTIRIETACDDVRQVTLPLRSVAALRDSLGGL